MPNNSKKIVAAPLRIPPELKAKVDEAARLMHAKPADVMRLALAIGLEDLARINHDVAGVISRAVMETAEAPPQLREPRHQPLKVAEDPAPYTSAPRANGGKS